MVYRGGGKRLNKWKIAAIMLGVMVPLVAGFLLDMIGCVGTKACYA